MTKEGTAQTDDNGIVAITNADDGSSEGVERNKIKLENNGIYEEITRIEQEDMYPAYRDDDDIETTLPSHISLTGELSGDLVVESPATPPEFRTSEIIRSEALEREFLSLLSAVRKNR